MLAERSCCAVICLTPSPGHDGFMHPVRGHETHGAGIGEGSCLPRSVTVLELKGGMTRQYEWKTGCKDVAGGVLGGGGVAVWSAPWCGQTRHGFTRPLHERHAMRRKNGKGNSYMHDGIADHILSSVSSWCDCKRAGADATNHVGRVRRGGLGLGGAFGLLGRHLDGWALRRSWDGRVRLFVSAGEKTGTGCSGGTRQRN